MSNRVPPGDLHLLLVRAHDDNKSGGHDGGDYELCSRCAMLAADIEAVVREHERKYGRRKYARKR